MHLYDAEYVSKPAPAINCDGCVKCCKNHSLIVILPEDRQNFYQTEKMELPDGRITEALQFQENGDCVYLIDNKCSIYGMHPLICQRFSCAEQFSQYSRTERRILIKQGSLDPAVVEEGRKRAKKP